MTDGDNTRLERIEADIHGISTRLTAQETRSEINWQNAEKRLTVIEDGQKWLMRLIVGVIITSAIIFVVNGGLAR